MSNTSSNKLAILEAINLLSRVLADTPFGISKLEVHEEYASTHYITVILSITNDELLQMLLSFEENVHTQNTHVQVHPENGLAEHSFEVAEVERQYNKELLDLGELDEQTDYTSAKPATVSDAQKQPKVVRRRQTKSRVDEDEVGDTLAKRKPKPVTAAQNMTPRKVSRDELNSLASQFDGDWEKDLDVDSSLSNDIDKTVTTEESEN